MFNCSIPSGLAQIPSARRLRHSKFSTPIKVILSERNLHPHNIRLTKIPIEQTNHVDNKGNSFSCPNTRNQPPFVAIYQKPQISVLKSSRTLKQNTAVNSQPKRLSMILTPLKYSQANLNSENQNKLNINRIKE